MDDTDKKKWREKMTEKPIKSCGRLDMHTYLPEPVTVGRVTSDCIRYVYFEDGGEAVVLGPGCDQIAFRAADWGPEVGLQCLMAAHKTKQNSAATAARDEENGGKDDG